MMCHVNVGKVSLHTIIMLIKTSKLLRHTHIQELFSLPDTCNRFNGHFPGLPWLTSGP